jgi:type II secretory pathway pseudopilin PulG
MISLVVFLVFGALLGLSFTGLSRARKEQAEVLRVQRLMAAIPTTRIADVPETGRIHVVGRATGEGGATVTAPGSGREAIWVRTMLPPVPDWARPSRVDFVGNIVIDDGSGRVLHVNPRGAGFRLPWSSSLPAADFDRVTPARRHRGWQPVGVAESFEGEMRLAPGETVDVIGTLADPEGPYRKSVTTLCLEAIDGEILVINAEGEKKSLEKQREAAGCATAGIVVFAAALLITAVVAVAR